LNTGELYSARIAITENRQLYLPKEIQKRFKRDSKEIQKRFKRDSKEIQKRLEGAGSIRIQLV